MGGHCQCVVLVGGWGGGGSLCSIEGWGSVQHRLPLLTQDYKWVQ